MAATQQAVFDIPLFNVGPMPSAELCRRDLPRVRHLVDEALSRRSHPLLPVAVGIIDRISRTWLARQATPYLEEIRQVAASVGKPGAYFLNSIYEWACSTSAAPEPKREGARMIRVLDWGLCGLGRYAVIARHETAHGPFFDATWPGFAGVLTAMAPGRFSAAINQGPRMPVLGVRFVDDIATGLRVLCSCGAVPAAHLLRYTFEEAAGFEAAVAMLADERFAVAMPVLFVIAGVEAAQCCVVEAWGRQRRIHRANRAVPGALGVANQWLSPDLGGRARCRAVRTDASMTPEENNAARRSIVCQLQDGNFAGAADLPEPVINSHTVMVVVANARRGEMSVETLDRLAGSLIPRIVARRRVRMEGMVGRSSDPRRAQMLMRRATSGTPGRRRHRGS